MALEWYRTPVWECFRQSLNYLVGKTNVIQLGYCRTVKRQSRPLGLLKRHLRLWLSTENAEQ